MMLEELNFKDFSFELLQTIESEIQIHIQKNIPPFYAAFDADGTLWGRDAGESFFKYQIESSCLKDLPKDPWGYYQTWKEKDPQGAYLWLAQINQGQTLSQVRAWARDCLKKQKSWPIFPAQMKLIQWLRSKGFRVFVVTASIKWAVEPFAELLGFHYDDVVGVETKVCDGVVTDELSGVVTWKEGKSQALLEKTQGIAPVLCVGNTMGDVSLITCSQRVKLAVSCSREEDEIFETELALQKMARENQWLSHSFI